MDWVEEVEREEKRLTPTPEPVVLPSPTPPIPMDSLSPTVGPVEKSAFDKRLFEKKWYIRREQVIL